MGLEPVVQLLQPFLLRKADTFLDSSSVLCLAVIYLLWGDCILFFDYRIQDNGTRLQAYWTIVEKMPSLYKANLRWEYLRVLNSDVYLFFWKIDRWNLTVEAANLIWLTVIHYGRASVWFGRCTFHHERNECIGTCVKFLLKWWTRMSPAKCKLHKYSCI